MITYITDKLKGYVDKRPVVAFYPSTKDEVAIVLNDDGTYTSVTTTTYWSASWDDEIHGKVLANVAVDATQEQRNEYKRKLLISNLAPYEVNGEICPRHINSETPEGAVVEIVRGKKYPVGTRGYFVSYAGEVRYGNSKTYYIYLQTEKDVIRVDSSNCLVVNIPGKDLKCEPLTIEDSIKMNYECLEPINFGG